MALSQIDGCTVCVEKRQSDWDDIPFIEDFDSIRDDIPIKKCDVALCIRTPHKFRHLGIPTAIYTQNALGKLPNDWIDNLQQADAIFVPGQFDKNIFDNHFDNVHICPQHVDPRVFKHRPRYRPEGGEEFTFLFVGAWGYRKGCDLIVPAITKAFSGDLDTRIHLHCFAGFEKQMASNLIEGLSKAKRGPIVSTYFGNLNPNWMNRVYNRADAVFTLSRGEGWCMPLYEALLCHKPVIAPASTAMEEWLPKNGVRLIKTSKKKVCDIDSEFGTGFKKGYNVPENYFWEPDFKDTVAAFKDIKKNYEKYSSQAVDAKKEITKNFSLKVLANKILPVLKSIM